MECTRVQSEIDVVVFVTRVWLVFLCLFFGIFLGICVTIIIFICWYKVFDKGKKCSKDRCCLLVAFGALKKRMRRSSSVTYDVMLDAWEDSDSYSGDECSQLTGETVTVFIEDDEGEKRVLVHDDAAMGKAETTIDQEQHSASYLDARPDSGQRYRPVSLAEILSQPNQETSNSLMFENEKKSILKIEAKFIQQKSDLFLFMLDCICTQIATAELASEDWKQSLHEYCLNEFARTKKRTRSHSISNLESLLPRMPETFQINMNAVVAKLFDYLHKSLEKETEVGVMEVEEIMNEFQTNWSAFERIHSDIYLSQLKEVNHHFMKRAKIVEAIEQENSELMDEMIQHVDNHINALRGIQGRVTDAYFDIPRSENRLAPELEEIWQSTLEHFQMDLRRQKIQLSMEIQEQLDVEKKKYATNYEQELQDIQKEVIREDGSMKDYVDKYCEMLQAQFKERMRLTQLETQITANGFSSLTETVGNRYLQTGMRTEGNLYADFLERSNWIDPSVTDMITQHQNNLVKLETNLKELRKMQYNRLQTKINERMEEKRAANSKSADDMNTQHKSIKEVIELQADLSESECQQLLDQCMAQQRSFEAQLELNRIKQERRLEQRLRQQRAKLSKAMKQVNSDDSINPDTKLRASLRYKQEEKELLDSHHQSMEELQKKMCDEIEEAKRVQDLFFQQKLEQLRRGHERRLLLANKQEQAIKSLKDKLLNRLASGAEQSLGERIIKEHQINKETLEETIQKNQLYQQQVLQQKLQARKLDKKQEKERDFKRETTVEPYRPGSAKRFAANALVSLLFEVRHKRAVKKLESQLAGEGDRVKLQIERKFRIHSKLELQLREAEMVAKLATALGMTRGELEAELKNSVQEQGHRPNSEYGILLSRSVMAIFDGSESTPNHSLYELNSTSSEHQQ